MKMFINAYDNGTVYIVNNAFVSEKMPMTLNPDVKTIEIKDTQVFAIISEELLQNNTVKLSNKMTEYTPSDIIVDVVDDLAAAKYASTMKVRDFIARRAGSAYIYDIFEFQLASNILYSEGIFITDSNREAKYIEIIETNRVELIEALEKYLNIKDKMTEYYSLYAQGKVAMDLINNANTLQNVEMYLNNFLASFN